MLRSLRLVAPAALISLAACGGGYGVDAVDPVETEAAGVERRFQADQPHFDDPGLRNQDQIPDPVIWGLASADLNERLNAIDSLSQLDNDNIIALLRQASLDPSAELRSAVVDALADIGTRTAILNMTFALSDPDLTVREDAVLALAENGSATALDLLHHALADDNAGIRELAAEAIAELSG